MRLPRGSLTNSGDREKSRPFFRLPTVFVEAAFRGIILSGMAANESSKNRRESVSVVIPVYNRPLTLIRAVRSCFWQTFPPLEVVVVDDGSTDGTADALGALAQEDGRVRVFRFERNKGAQHARIEGIKRSRGDWVAFLDSDDELTPDSIELRLRAAQESGIAPGLVYGDTLYEHEAKRVVVPVARFKGPAYKEILRDLYLGCYDTFLIRKECFRTCGYPTESMPSYQDRDMALVVARHFPVLHCGAVVCVCRPGPGQITSNLDALVTGNDMMLRKYGAEVLRHCGPFRLALMKFQGFRGRLKRRHVSASSRHRRLAGILGMRLHPLRVAHAAYVRALHAALRMANRFLRHAFSKPYWFTD